MASVEEFFTVLPWDSYRNSWTVFRTGLIPCCCFDASVKRASGCTVKKFSTLSICSSGPGLLPVGCCSGFREPVFLKWSDSLKNVSRAGIFWGFRWQSCFRKLMRTLDWHNSFILQNKAPSLEKGRWSDSVEIGLLGISLIISRQFEWAAKYYMEITCSNTHFLGMHVLTWKNQMRLRVFSFTKGSWLFSLTGMFLQRWQAAANDYFCIWLLIMGKSTGLIVMLSGKFEERLNCLPS